VSGDYGLGYKVHEDAYCELEEEAERYRLEANAMMLQRDRLAEALREIAEGSPWGRRNAIWIAEQALAEVKGGKP